MALMREETSGVKKYAVFRYLVNVIQSVVDVREFSQVVLFEWYEHFEVEVDLA